MGSRVEAGDPLNADMQDRKHFVSARRAWGWMMACARNSSNGFRPRGLSNSSPLK